MHMAVKIDIKHNNTPGVVPTTSSINLNEIAFNTYDGKAYFKQDGTNISIKEFVATPFTGSVNISGSITLVGDLSILSGSGDLYIHGNKQFNYGVFQNNTTLSGSANVSYSFHLDTTDEAHEISITNNTLGQPTRITFANSGVYDLQFSAQISQGANSADLYIWFKKNGDNIPESATVLTVPSNQKLVAAWNFIKTFAAGDYAELAWQSNNNNTTFPFIVASGNIPAIPSIIVTVNQVR